jgi:hypothetical protein
MTRSRRSTKSRSGGTSSRGGARGGTSARGRSSTRAMAGRKSARTASAARSSGVRRSGGVSGAARTTRDHDEIRQWVEQRGGAPASVTGTQRGGQHAGLLRIDFPGGAGEDRLQHISWDEFFEKFDESNLAFLYQDKTKGGKESRFFKLVTAP